MKSSFKVCKITYGFDTARKASFFISIHIVHQNSQKDDVKTFIRKSMIWGVLTGDEPCSCGTGTLPS